MADKDKEKAKREQEERFRTKMDKFHVQRGRDMKARIRREVEAMAKRFRLGR